MIQEIITYAILLTTAIITTVNIYKFFTKKDKSACGGCAQAHSGCKVAELKHKITKHHKPISFE